MNSGCRREEPPIQTERVVAPITVLGFHLLLLFDVVVHRKHLWHVQGPRGVLELAVAAAAVAAYLRTVLAEPGFLRAEPLPQNKRPQSPRWLTAACWAPFACLIMLWQKATRGRHASSGAANPRFDSNAAGRDRGAAGDVRELQPIGRSALDDVEVEGSDPGEEVINLADLEGGNLLRVASQGQTGELGGDRAVPTLGAVPGSPVPGHRGRTRMRGSPSPPRPGRAADGAPRRSAQPGQPRLRFCKVCQLYQPLRTKHCRDCERCVRTHDHHCPWVGTCVGEGNRTYFYWFLFFQWLELTTFGTEGLLELFEKGLFPSVWLERAPGLVLGLLVILLMLIMVSCLLCFHTYLALANVTTWENISWHNISYLRSLDPKEGSPFSGSLRFNLAVYCCAPDVPCAPQDMAALKRTEDGWAVWELGQARSPLEVDCDRCLGGPLKGIRVNPCSCFDVQ